MAGIMPDGGVDAPNAQGADVTITAEDLVNCPGGPLFNPTNRCTSRFDPKSQNALISEAINLMKEAGVDYDCSRFDNLATAVHTLFNKMLVECLEVNFAVASGPNACTIEQLVLATGSDGCRRISRYSDTAATVGRAENSSVWGINYPAVAHPLTGQTTVNTHIYEIDLLGAAITANDVDQTVLMGPGNQNYLGTITFDLSCNSTVEIAYTQTMAFEPLQAGGGGAKAATILRVDGVLIQEPNGRPVNFGLMSNFQAVYDGRMKLSLAAGTHTVDFILTAGGGDAARVMVAGSTVQSGASWTVRVAN